MVVFPILSALISALCAGVIAWDAWRKPRPDKIAWIVAFVLFTVAAAAEAIGSLAGWSPALIRLYYLAGAVLVVGYLALGELYLLARPKIEKIAPGATLLVTAVCASIVIKAPIDRAKLDADGWEALERGPALIIAAVTLNAGGTLVIVGGLLYSAWTFKKKGIQRHRMIGCTLIALGTLIVAMGGTATRLGAREYFYVMMATGAATIFAGYLYTRRPDGQPVFRRAAPALAGAAAGVPSAALASPAPVPAASNGASAGHVATSSAPSAPAENPAFVYLETRLLPLDDAALDARCTAWSVPRDPAPIFTREEAIRAWRLRARLSPAAQERFDALPLPAQRQLTELYHGVMTAELPTQEYALGRA